MTLTATFRGRAWIRARPELDGRLLQPSNQLASQPDLVDVFLHSDRIVDVASVDFNRVSDGASPMFVEITHPWPPTEANVLESRCLRDCLHLAPRLCC